MLSFSGLDLPSLIPLPSYLNVTLPPNTTQMDESQAASIRPDFKRSLGLGSTKRRSYYPLGIGTFCSLGHREANVMVFMKQRPQRHTLTQVHYSRCQRCYGKRIFVIESRFKKNSIYHTQTQKYVLQPRLEQTLSNQRRKSGFLFTPSINQWPLVRQ